MIEIEIDGKKVEVQEGSMVMHAASKLDIYVPHFCYHKKLSIAANCRMCLVEVEKAPKPLPACATPVAAGMVVRTHSEKAVQAQKSVMEFLLINHPLDCPICDQGGECQLQDLAVGYGGSSSRYQEEKRVVFYKDIGPLVSAQEMTRCIHCTRCVRFGQEIAGVMELGMVGRGEHSEIMSFVGNSVDSELSGNMIDICPVGALTSKPFRYSARTWELSRRKSVSPHDSLGSNLIVQVKQNTVMRVLPLENEEVNECWISDRDRFSYEGLNSADRLTKPMLKQNGEWVEVEWSVALEYVAHGLSMIQRDHGAATIGALAAGYSTTEELYLLQKLLRGLGSENIDFRLRQSDFSADGHRAGVPWLGLPVAQINHLDRVLLIGSFLRKDHPLLAARVRDAVKHGAQVSVLHAAYDDLLMPVANKFLSAPSAWSNALAEIAAAVAKSKGVAAPLPVKQTSDMAQQIAASLLSGEKKAILLGNAAVQHPQAAQLQVLAQWLAEQTGASFGVLTEQANTVGGYLANALPSALGLNAQAMLAQPRKAYLALHAELELDSANGYAARKALAQAEMVVLLTSYKPSQSALESADVLLPVAPFSETSGTFVNAEGRVQSFNGAVRPLGDTRPAWKVLRVLGNLLKLSGFDYESSEAVRSEVLGSGEIAGKLNNQLSLPLQVVEAGAATLERLADVPAYFGDAIVRRAESLQLTKDAQAPQARMSSATLKQLGLQAGQTVKVKQGQGSAQLMVALDDSVAADTVRIAAAHASTASLAGMFGPVSVEAA
ncbi:MAG: NADH-quinone oxidoreductase subunit G [Burkholderiaceae bacterium]|nr:MAG: NADH-quinone oxidoreductase subunit G [Burkholderiaceae bacterium]